MVSAGVDVWGTHPHTAVWTCSHEMSLSWWEGNINLFDWMLVSIVLEGKYQNRTSRHSDDKASAEKFSLLYFSLSSPQLLAALVPCIHQLNSFHCSFHRYLVSSTC